MSASEVLTQEPQGLSAAPTTWPEREDAPATYNTPLGATPRGTGKRPTPRRLVGYLVCPPEGREERKGKEGEGKTCCPHKEEQRQNSSEFQSPGSYTQLG